MLFHIIYTYICAKYLPTRHGEINSLLDTSDTSDSQAPPTKGVPLFDSSFSELEVVPNKDINWIYPPTSNSGKWGFFSGFPTKNVIILVVTGILGGG